MSPNRTVAGRDHLDLLVTAAGEYGLLVDETTAAFSRAAAGIIATPSAAGQLLIEENVAAVRWQTSRGRGNVRLDLELLHYDHRPVDFLEPVEVIKAAHCYQHLAGESPGWAGSAANRLITAIVHAATERLPGYAESPWHWTRPKVRRGTPIGLCRDWVPLDEGVTWVTPAELSAGWEDASLVLICVQALTDLPADLPRRPGVYVCASRILDEAYWEGITRLSPDVVVTLPSGRDWLLEQLGEPQRASRRSRLNPALPAYLH